MRRISIVVAIALGVLAVYSFALNQTKVLAADAASRPASRPATRPTSRPAMPKELTLALGKGVTMKLKLIPAGKFMMGSPDGEDGRASREGPQREVTISKAFYMGVHEVTQAQYQALIGKNPSRPPNISGGDKNVQKPVGDVSWDDAVAFGKKLSAKTGKKVRLPTEAQWEYACRAGTQTRFGFGDDAAGLDEYAWYGRGDTHPVGQKEPNAWGLYDMHGNVWEWCSDWYAKAYANAGTIDPQGAASGKDRVLRGGGSYSPVSNCSSSGRHWLSPDSLDGGYGFRVVVDAE